ncbi:MAG: hypothetical protein ABEJ82_09400 [Haloplanus sp.]
MAQHPEAGRMRSLDGVDVDVEDGSVYRESKASASGLDPEAVHVVR